MTEFKSIFLLVLLLVCSCRSMLCVNEGLADVNELLADAWHLEQQSSYIPAADKYIEASLLYRTFEGVSSEKLDAIKKRMAWCHYQQAIIERNRGDDMMSLNFARQAAGYGSKSAMEFLEKHYTVTISDSP